MVIRNKKWARVALIAYFILIFTIITIWSYKTPFLNDDLIFSHNSIIKKSIKDYFDSNGRLFGQIFTRFILSKGVLFSSICTGAAFSALTLILMYITNSIKNGLIYLERLLLVTISLFLFIPGFASVFLWRAGVGNYLIPAIIEFLFLLIILETTSNAKWVPFLVFILGFFAGWGNENTSGGILLICILLIVKNYLNDKKVPLKLHSGTVGLLIGYIILMVSPGSKKRAHSNDFDYLQQGIFKRLIQGLERQVSFFYTDYWTIVFIALVIIVVVVAFTFWKNNSLFADGIILIIGGIAAGAVMIISPEGMDTGRTYFGSTLLLLIGTMKLIPLEINSKGIKVIYTSTLLVLMLMCFFNVVEGIQVADKFNSQLFTRYNYIDNSTNKVVEVTPITLNEYNKYDLSSIYWEVKHSTNTSTFPNNCYYKYFNKRVTLK